MNHLRNTIKRYIQSDSVHVTVLAFGSVGFCAGGLVGVSNGVYTALSDAVYSRTQYQTTRQRIGQSVYTVANMFGQPIIGAIAGTAIGVTAPISIPVLYYLYQKAEKEEMEERMQNLIEVGKTI